MRALTLAATASLMGCGPAETEATLLQSSNWGVTIETISDRYGSEAAINVGAIQTNHPDTEIGALVDIQSLATRDIELAMICDDWVDADATAAGLEAAIEEWNQLGERLDPDNDWRPQISLTVEEQGEEVDGYRSHRDLNGKIYSCKEFKKGIKEGNINPPHGVVFVIPNEARVEGDPVVIQRLSASLGSYYTAYGKLEKFACHSNNADDCSKDIRRLVGHLLGLEHPRETAHGMSNVEASELPDELTPGDAEALRCIYKHGANDLGYRSSGCIIPGQVQRIDSETYWEEN